MRSVKAHSHEWTTIATAVDTSNWFHRSLLVCSHDATVTKTSSQSGSNGYISMTLFTRERVLLQSPLHHVNGYLWEELR